MSNDMPNIRLCKEQVNAVPLLRELVARRRCVSVVTLHAAHDSWAHGLHTRFTGEINIVAIENGIPTFEVRRLLGAPSSYVYVQFNELHIRGCSKDGTTVVLFGCKPTVQAAQVQL